MARSTFHWYTKCKGKIINVFEWRQFWMEKIITMFPFITNKCSHCSSNFPYPRRDFYSFAQNAKNHLHNLFTVAKKRKLFTANVMAHRINILRYSVDCVRCAFSLFFFFEMLEIRTSKSKLIIIITYICLFTMTQYQSEYQNSFSVQQQWKPILCLSSNKINLFFLCD